MTDSLGRDINCLNPDIDTIFKPGSTITGMRGSLPNLSAYKCVVLLVGTNDMVPKWVWLRYKYNIRKGNSDYVVPSHSRTPVHRIIEDYERLIMAVKAKNPTIHILISSILPRPFDFRVNKDYLISVNNGLRDMCKRLNRCEFIPTYRGLMKSNKPKSNCFLHSDGLHLFEDGTIIVKRFFTSKIAELFRKL